MRPRAQIQSIIDQQACKYVAQSVQFLILCPKGEIQISFKYTASAVYIFTLLSLEF